MNTKLELIKSKLDLHIDDSTILPIMFEMSRFYDKEFTNMLKKVKKESGLVFDTPSRKQLRLKYYYGNSYINPTLKYNIDSCQYNNEEDINTVIDDFTERLKNYNEDKILESMKKRLVDLEKGATESENVNQWLQYYDNRRRDKLFSFASIKVNQKIFKEANYDENYILNFINKTYNSLENYRHLAIIVEDEIFNKANECITWNLMYKAGIYAENFIKFNGKFFAFKQDKQISQLVNFLEERNISNAQSIANSFYSNICYGYKFEDCYISNTQKTKILIFKKIELDSTNVPCPSCGTTIQRGNSFPEMFLRSWECQNPSCPDRSKSGRGKRFDEYGTYRYFKLVENDKENQIDESFYQNWRRDIFDDNLDWKEFLIKEYTFKNEKILAYNYNIDNLYGRIIVNNKHFDSLKPPSDAELLFEDLPIYKLFKSITITSNSSNSIILKHNLEILNENSTTYMASLEKNQIGTAITSPPYYNAREYSQWNNLILYLIDMMINSKGINSTMVNNSYYLYNIGDIVCEDNVYVESNMSKRRIQLGFLSAMIFEIAGFNLVGNIIWDKGEVQSKRNSTQNLFSGYVKCINCYEHVLIFRKGNYEKNYNHVVRINPVIKINSKGENTYKHTAPYPMELVSLVKPFVQDDYYVLDPFLGSGTTLKWCKENNYKGVGFELNNDYYKLCLDNINDINEQMNIF